MGIQGLLPCLASITHTVPLKRYKGLTVAVDAMSWLHKGIYACDVKALATAQSNEKQRPFEDENLTRIAKRLNYEKTQSSSRPIMNPRMRLRRLPPNVSTLFFDTPKSCVMSLICILSW
jgi:hypothetical protein